MVAGDYSPDKLTKAAEYLSKNIAKDIKAEIKRGIFLNGRDWLIARHHTLGQSVRNSLRRGGFEFYDADGIWCIILTYAVFLEG